MDKREKRNLLAFLQVTMFSDLSLDSTSSCHVINHTPIETQNCTTPLLHSKVFDNSSRPYLKKLKMNWEKNEEEWVNCLCSKCGAKFDFDLSHILRFLTHEYWEFSILVGSFLGAKKVKENPRNSLDCECISNTIA